MRADHGPVMGGGILHADITTRRLEQRAHTGSGLEVQRAGTYYDTQRLLAANQAQGTEQRIPAGVWNRCAKALIQQRTGRCLMLPTSITV